MASLLVNRGLQVIGSRASGLTAIPPSTAVILSMAIDSGSTAFVASDETIAASTFLAKVFDTSPPQRVGQTFSHITTFTTTEGNFTIRRVSLHNLAAASVSSASTSLVGGVDGQSITKTTEFSLEVTLDLTYSNA